MTYYDYSISSPLSEYIQSIWALESENDEDIYPRSIIMPDGIVEIIFHYGTPFLTWQDGNELLQPANFAISMMQKYVEIASTGKTGFISVRFFPWGAYHFFKEPIKNFLDTTIDASQLWGDDSLAIINDLRNRSTIESRFKLVENFLLDKLNKHKVSGDKDAPIKYIRETKGLLSIEDVCINLTIPKKRLERSFLATVGTTPKIFSRITRFLHVCSNLDDYRGKHITQLAYDCGFSDQSHFIKEFKSFSGFTPKEYFEKENVFFSEI